RSGPDRGRKGDGGPLPAAGGARHARPHPEARPRDPGDLGGPCGSVRALRLGRHARAGVADRAPGGRLRARAGPAARGPGDREHGMSDVTADPGRIDAGEPARPATLRALRASGWRSRSVKDELRANLIDRLAAGETVLPGVVGYEES